MTFLNPLSRPADIGDLVQRIQDEERFKVEKKGLEALVRQMVQRFRDRPLPSYYTDASRLSDVTDAGQYNDLMRKFQNEIIEHSSEGNVPDRDLLPSYNYGLRRHRGRTSGGYLMAPLKALSTRLKTAIEMADLQTQYHLVFIIGSLLEIANDIKVSGIDHDEVHQPLLKQLRELREHDEPRLSQAASYAYEALRGVPDNLGPWDVFWRTGGTVFKVLTKLASAVPNMDPSKFIEAAPDFFEMVELFSKLLESIQDIKEGAQDLKGAFLEDIERSGKSRIWSDVLHFTGPLLAAGDQSPEAAAKAFTILQDVLGNIPCENKWQFWSGLYAQLEQSWINGNDNMKTQVVEFVQRTFSSVKAKDVRVQKWIALISETMRRPEWVNHGLKHQHRFPFHFKNRESTTVKLQKPFRQEKKDRTPEHLLDDAWRTCPEAQEFYAYAGVIRYYLQSERLMIRRLSGSKLDMESCYINLSLVENLIEYEKPREELETSMRERLKAPRTTDQQNFQLRELFEKRKLRDERIYRPKRVLIRGRPGVGKTTLCKKIVHDFIHGRLPWKFDHIFWIPLRSLRKYSSLEEFLQQEFFAARPDQELLGEALKRILFAQTSSKTLFLLDGFDEIAEDARAEGRLRDLFGLFQDRKNVIITSRPYAISASEFNDLDLELETIGFLPDQVQEYLSQAGSQGEISMGEVEKIKAFVEENWLLDGLLQIPIQLDALCYTWGNDLLSQDARTMTALYRAIEVKLWRRDMVKLGRVKQFKADKCFDRMQLKGYTENSMDLIEEIAFNGLYNKIVDFPTAQLQTLYDNLPGRAGESDASLMGLSFLRTVDASLSNKTFYFIHLTFQEFFAANYFVRCWVDDQPLVCFDLETDECTKQPTKEFLQCEKYNGRYDIVWRFVAGLLCTPKHKHKLVEFMEVLDGEPRDLFGPAQLRILMHCFSEIAALPDTEPALGDVKRRMEKGLSRMMSSSLSREMEFPEHLLRDAFHDSFGWSSLWIRKVKAIEAISRRTQISSSLLQEVADCYCPRDSEDLNSYLAPVFAQHYREWPEKIVQVLGPQSHNNDLRINILHRLPGGIKLPDRILALVISTFDVPQDLAQESAALMIQQQSSLSEANFQSLVALLDSESAIVKRWAIIALSGHLSTRSNIPPKILRLRTDSDSRVRRQVANALGLVSGRAEDLEALVHLLRDSEDRVRVEAARSLDLQHSLPPGLLDDLRRATQDVHPNVRQWALSAWSKNCSSAESVFETLFSRDYHDERYRVAERFRRQSPLTKEMRLSLMMELDSQNLQRKFGALAALETQEDLSDEILAALLPLLEDHTDQNLHRYVVGVFANQTVLPDFAVQPLASQLSDEGLYFSKPGVMTALSHCRKLPENVLEVTLSSFCTLDNQEALLCNQDSLPTGILQMVASFLVNDPYGNTKYHAERILRRRDAFYSMLPSLNANIWISLFQIWFEKSLEENWSCYCWKDTLHLSTPQGVHTIPLDTKSTLRKLAKATGALEDEKEEMFPDLQHMPTLSEHLQKLTARVIRALPYIR
ncbi:hypothetical protein ASPZODRAFT_2109333 [Penicilliopsis zonata CBS 506.65]|uniref:NACHT domain-containing protein n=1 Tax=Penicilliopsis zonata CBS 506.65 TaxID=1073090 RepID=A0A1L9SFB7_9EURO|nr:hypothetical protein ASPZODRAFT_2109333 [Penicilliopsis zonata CBS 506.65]OJJ45910.1 hypothetical protein ASPZODRAFT_2109333 [Penicilliopsis zonata CBS 506.65]